VDESCLVMEFSIMCLIFGFISYTLLIRTYLLTHSLTSWCRILYEKLIVTQFIKKYPAFFIEPEGSSSCL
jgi:hypothetical protein